MNNKLWVGIALCVMTAGFGLCGCQTSNSSIAGHSRVSEANPVDARHTRGPTIVEAHAPATTAGKSSAPVTATPGPAPAATATDSVYTVARGDTLYSIAFRYGIDYKTLASINGIEPPYAINQGQQLRLRSSAEPRGTSVYTVKSGDTIYSIAAAHHVTPGYIANLNQLGKPYVISIGQRLKVPASAQGQSASPAPAVATTPAATTASTKPAVKPAEKPVASAPRVEEKPAPAAKTEPAPEPARAASDNTVYTMKSRKVSGVEWSWPASGKVIAGFSTGERGNKGVDIAGTLGQRVLAAADGQVVYAGSALRGYGNLIIINHDQEFLSAYAHNDVIMVKEGQKVRRGQQIARMGSTDTSSVRLHFEIRSQGESVNPVNYLPK